MTKTDKQALRIPDRKRSNWSQAVMRDCDFCSQWALTIKHDEGGCICASCCDSEYTTALMCALAMAIDRVEAAEKRIAELENDEVRQRLANAEHQLYMAELAKHNLKASRKAQFRKRKAAELRIAELEARRLTVKLPEYYYNSDGSVNRDMTNTCEIVSAFVDGARVAGIALDTGE